MTTLVLGFKKAVTDDKTKHYIFYSHLKAKTIINESDIDGVFKSMCNTIISNM